ncbi:MAG: SMI1/KNR4 family protein [Deltaproteobacteria bacterium]|nr:SMI1/KNR4 family protein [Deltaproteobacteria bacterium]MDQ3295739.1 SMI1/KNR4 family protein [Myxococcota bacterium]
MSELNANLRETLAALAAGDRRLMRFGAAHHRYELAPPITEAALVTIERALGPLPDDLRELASTAGDGGVGPYHGWLPLARAAELVYAARPGRAIPVSHLGCGYAASVILDGDAHGQIWLDARALGIVTPIAPSFAAFYLHWIDCLAHDRLPEAHVPPGVCALAHALGSYLGLCEQRLGLEPGTITGEPLRAALAELGPGAIAIGAEQSPLYPDGTHVAPCLACATLLENLGIPPATVSGPRAG